jgi:hypothetical protein
VKRIWLALIIAAAQTAQASVLDWDNATIDWTQTWTSNAVFSINQTFNNVDGSGCNITITLTRGNSTFLNEVNGTSGTQPNDDQTPITFNSESSLRVDVDYSNRTNDFVTYTITFSQPVVNATFQIWDIDLGNTSGTSTYQDVIGNFTGTPTLTTVGNATDLIVSGSTFRGIASLGSNSSLGNENDNDGTGRGLVDYSDLLADQLTSLSFTYFSGNGSGAGVSIPTDPTLQRISLHDIYFTVVPEPSTWAAAAALAVFATVQTVRAMRRRRQPG